MIRFPISSAAAFCGFLILMLFSDLALADRRVALVIGNSAYQNVSKLPNPPNDAEAISGLLKNSGFTVVTARDLGIQKFRRAVRNFTDAARDAEVAIVFFAGHGIEIGGTNYLIPVDAKLETDLDIEDEAISLDRVMRSLDDAKRLRLVILDACRDNPFSRSMRRTVSSRSIGRGLAKVEPTSTDTLVAFAAKAGSTADDGKSANSPFTTALLKHIAVPGLDVRIAFGRVRDEVLRQTGRRQEPFVYGSLGGDIISLVPPKPVAQVRADPHAEARKDYEFALSVGSREIWDAFLNVHKSGLYADLARSQLAKLNAAEPGKPQGEQPKAAGTIVAALAPPAQPQSSEASSEAARTWDQIRDSGDIAALQAFIKRFPSSVQSTLAQNRLDVLERAAREREEKARAEREAALRRDEERRAKEAGAAREREEKTKAQREAALRLQEETRQKAAAAAQEKVEADRKRVEEACKHDEQRLAKIQEVPARLRAELARFQKELGCERLRPTLRELLAKAPADVREPTAPKKSERPARATEPAAPARARSEAAATPQPAARQPARRAAPSIGVGF